MTLQYASDQPAGYKNHPEKIAIVGVGGNVGKYVTEALLGTGKHQITAITREDSTNVIPAGVTVAKVDYSKLETLVAALRGHDALVITMSVMAPPDSQNTIIDAAATAGIPWIMPNEWSSSPDQTELQNDIAIGRQAAQVRAYIEGKSISRLGIACNFWYEHSLCVMPVAYGFDLPNCTATFCGNGSTGINTTTWPQCGRAAAALFSLPLFPQDANDTGLTLQQFRNKPMYISSFYVNQQEMLASLQRVTGTTGADWTVRCEDVKQRFASGQKELAAGDRRSFGKLLYARVFYPDGCGTYQSKLHNKAFGLHEEDLDEATRRGVELSKTDYMQFMKS